jgi:hypothetical protein
MIVSDTLGSLKYNSDAESVEQSIVYVRLLQSRNIILSLPGVSLCFTPGYLLFSLSANLRTFQTASLLRLENRLLHIRGSASVENSPLANLKPKLRIRHKSGVLLRM